VEGLCVTWLMPVGIGVTKVKHVLVSITFFSIIVPFLR